MRDIFNKKAWHSTAAAYGIDSQQLYALQHVDLAERNGFFENLLMRGEQSQINNYFTNPSLRALFKYPSPKRMREINRIREMYGRKALPEQFERRPGGSEDEDE
ncbi:MAG: hypothetical protein JO026_03790 [Patescibacteria group bacterium]|nr:hypothetical protein [Patescibacteria group bacterium]